MGEFSLPHLIIVLVIFLLLFGPSRLGDLGASLGKGIRGFKRAMNEPDEAAVTPPEEKTKRIEAVGLENMNNTAEKKEETK
jgi:sec-independent protein translocase protein TatA